MTSLAWGVASHVGRVRSVNQDRALALDGFFAVADGMGGHAGGEVAAAVAVDSLADEVPVLSLDELVDAVRLVNDRILERATADPSLAGMGTTLVAIARIEDPDRSVDGPSGDPMSSAVLALVNVGDSRAYLLRADGFEQLTDDHSLVAALVREGRLARADAERHPQKNILTRALGVEPDVHVDAWELVAAPGDRYVLCSDGLTNELTEDQMVGVLRRLAAPQEAADELVRLAVAAGGRDNVTAVVVDVVGSSALPAGGRATHAGVDDDTVSLRATRAVPAATVERTVAGRTGAAPPTSDGEPGAVVAAGAGHRARERREARPPLVTWRVVAFVLALALVVGAAGYAVRWYGTHTWYVGTSLDADGTERVALYQGRSVLWMHPRVREVALPVNELSAADRDRVAEQKARTEAEARQLFEVLSAATTTTAAPTTTAPAPASTTVSTVVSTSTTSAPAAPAPTAG